MKDFTLIKLGELVDQLHFSLFYCHYFDEVIVKSQRLEKKPSTFKALDFYTLAVNILLQNCQKTLIRVY
jgi:hypothetical protein